MDSAFNGQVYVAVSDEIVASIDRIAWADVSPSPPPGYPGFRSVASDGQSFVAIGSDEIYFSPDGLYWARVDPPPSHGGLTTVRYVGGQYIAFAYHSQWVSSDGQAWVEEPYSFPENWSFWMYDAVESHGQLRAVGWNGNILRYGHLFIDGFESGDMSAWSGAVP